MVRSELIKAILVDNDHLSQKDIERVVSIIFDRIIVAMTVGDRVELRGFGSFSVRHRAAHLGRNPRTGESVYVNEKYVAFFKPSKLLCHRLNNN